jgi:hypothetical protein
LVQYREASEILIQEADPAGELTDMPSQALEVATVLLARITATIRDVIS